MQKVLPKFIKSLNIPISEKYCAELIESHPDFPSILSIADTLDNLEIDHKIYQAEDEKSIDSLELPFLLQSDSQGGKIHRIGIKKDLNEFRDLNKNWSGAIIKIFPNKMSSNNIENSRRIEQERSIRTNAKFIMLSAMVLIFVGIVDFNLFVFGYLFTSVFGCFLGSLLISKDLGIENSKVESFCYSKKNNRSGCDDLLTSDASSIFGFKLSELVISYFLIQALVLVVGSIGIQFEFLASIYILNILSIPFVLFSVYYQYFKAKVWCKLCLVVGVICITQIVLMFTHLGIDLTLHVTPVIIILSGFLLILSTVRLYKIGYSSFKESNNKLRRYSRILSAAEVFWMNLLKEDKIDYSLSNHEMMVGPIEAPIKLLLVGNLYCSPCKEFYQELSLMCKTYPTRISLTMRFIVSGKDYNEITSTNQYIIEYWLNNINLKYNESELTEDFITNWYNKMDLVKFRNLYPIEESPTDRSKNIELEHASWIEEMDIYKTPTLFVNGYKFPRDYRLEDLRNSIPNLVEFLYKEKKLEFTRA